MEEFGYMNGGQLQEIVRLQLIFRTLNRLTHERSMDEPELDAKESALYSLLLKRGLKTITELAEMMCTSCTETYYLLGSLQDKRLVKAALGDPIKFVAINRTR